MCCTTTTGIGKFAGRADSRRCRACGPPVEQPIASTLYSPSGRSTQGTVRSAGRREFRRLFTTFTSAMARTVSTSCLRVRSKSESLRVCGFSTTATAPSSRARNVTSRSVPLDSELTTTIGTGFSVMIVRIAANPSTCGMWISMVTRSGLRSRDIWMALAPSSATPTTFMSGSFSSMPLSSNAMTFESSAIRIRIIESPHELINHVQQDPGFKLVFYDIGIGANPYSRQPILFLAFGRNDDDRQHGVFLAFIDAFRQREPIHLRHLDICHHQVKFPGLDQIPCLPAVHRDSHLEAAHFQDIFLQRPRGDRIIYHQHMLLPCFAGCRPADRVGRGSLAQRAGHEIRRIQHHDDAAVTAQRASLDVPDRPQRLAQSLGDPFSVAL